EPSGAGVPAARGTAKNTETGAVRTTVTDDAGRYQVLSLPVGEYEVRVAKQGFQEEIRSGIHLAVGQEASMDMILHLGPIAEQVRVIAEVSMVTTTSADISGL